MYSSDAVSAACWRALLEWVIARADIECEVIDYPPPEPLPALWARDDLGCALMCGYPLARATPAPVVLAAMRPSPARYEHEPTYCTDLVVHVDSGLFTATDALGTRIAYTTENSQSGYHAPRRFFAPFPALQVVLSLRQLSARSSLQAMSCGPCSTGMPTSGHSIVTRTISCGGINRS